MREEKKSEVRPFAYNAFVGSVAGIGTCLLILAIVSIFILNGKIGFNLMEYIGTGAILIGSFLGGAFAAKKQKGRYLPLGLTEGGILFLSTIVIGAFMPRETLIGSATIPNAVAAIIGGGLAGLLCAKPKKTKMR